MTEILKRNQEQVKLLTNELNQFTIKEHQLDYSKTQLELLASQLWNVAKKLEVLATLDKQFEIYKSLDENPYVELDKPKHKIFSGRRMFTPEQVRWIRSSNLSVRKLADKFNCSLGTISQIQNRRTYKNIW
jgi:hypothetical protein